MKVIENAEDIYAQVNAFRRSRALLTAVELDVFSALANGAETSAQTADRIETDPRSTDRLMNVLVGMGLLTKSDDRFSLTEVSAKHLVSGSEAYLGNLAHLGNLWHPWSGLTAAVRRGAKEDRGGVQMQDPEWLESFIAAMHHRGIPQAPPDCNLIDLHDAARILDVGGGSGVYAMAMLRVKKDLTATVFDLPDVLPITQRYIDASGLAERMDTRAGDYLFDELGSGYDVVFLSAIIHSNSPEQNILLMRKCANALNPGGQVVVQDFIMEDDRVRPEAAAMFSLNMLVATEAGDTYTASEVEGWMSDAGLGDVIVRDAPSGTTQIVGWKPTETD